MRLAGVDLPWLNAVYIGLQALFFLLFPFYALSTVRNRGGFASLGLAAVCLAGAAIRIAFSVQVELFFEAAAMFGCMVLLEQREKTSELGMDNHFQA